MGASSSRHRLEEVIPEWWAHDVWRVSDGKSKIFPNKEDRKQFIELVEVMLSNNRTRDLRGLDFKLWYLVRPNGAHVVSLVALRKKVVAIKIESNKDTDWSPDWFDARMEFKRYVMRSVVELLQSIPDPNEVQVKLPKAATPDVPPAYGSTKQNAVEDKESSEWLSL